MSKEEDLLQLLADANSIINRLKAQLEAKAAQFKGLRGCSTARINQLQAEINRLTEENKKKTEIIRDYYAHCGKNMQICGLNTRAKQVLKGDK